EERFQPRIPRDRPSPRRRVVLARIDDHDAHPVPGVGETERQVELPEIARKEVLEVDRRRDQVHPGRLGTVDPQAERRDLLVEDRETGGRARAGAATGELAAYDALIEESAAVPAIVHI